MEKISKLYSIIVKNFQIIEFFESLLFFFFFIIFNYFVILSIKKFLFTSTSSVTHQKKNIENLYKSVLVFLFLINFSAETIGKIYFSLNFYLLIFIPLILYYFYKSKKDKTVNFINEKYKLNINFFSNAYLLLLSPILLFFLFIITNDLLFGPILKHDAAAYHLPSAINFDVLKSTSNVDYFKFHTNYFPHFSSVLYTYFLFFKNDLDGVISINILIILLTSIGIYLCSKLFIANKIKCLILSLTIFLIPQVIQQISYITNDIFVLCFFISAFYFFLKKDLIFFSIAISLLIASKFIGLILSFFLFTFYFIINFKSQFNSLKNYIYSIFIVLTGCAVYFENFIRFSNPLYPLKIPFFNNYYPFDFPQSIIWRIKKNSSKTLVDNGNTNFDYLYQSFNKFLNLITGSNLFYFILVMIIINIFFTFFKNKNYLYLAQRKLILNYRNIILLIIIAFIPIIIIGKPLDGDDTRYFIYINFLIIFLSIFLLKYIKMTMIKLLIYSIVLIFCITTYYPIDNLVHTAAKLSSKNRNNFELFINKNIPQDESFILMNNWGQLTYEFMNINFKRRVILLHPHGFHHDDYTSTSNNIKKIYDAIQTKEILMKGYKSENENYVFEKYGYNYFVEIKNKTNIKYIFSTLSKDFKYPKDWHLIQKSRHGKIFKIQ